jgi:hypothetical protein
MDEHRRDSRYDFRADDRDRTTNEREPNQQDDLTRRREQQRQSHLTHREREERWPIG